MELQWVLGAPEKLQVDHVIYGLADGKFEPVHQFYEDLSLFVSSAQHSIFSSVSVQEKKLTKKALNSTLGAILKAQSKVPIF